MESQSSVSGLPQRKMLAAAPTKVSRDPQSDMVSLSRSRTMLPSPSETPSPSQSTIPPPPQNLPFPQQALEEVPKKKRGHPRKIRPEEGDLEPARRPMKLEEPLFPNLISAPSTQEQIPKEEQPTEKRPTETRDPNDPIPKKRGRPPKPNPTPGGPPLPPYKVSFCTDWFREEWEFKVPPRKVPVIWTRPALPEWHCGPLDGYPVILTTHRGLTRGGYTWRGANGQIYTSWKEELDQSYFSAPVRRREELYYIMDDSLVDEDFCADPALSRNFDVYQYNRDMPHRLHQSQYRDAISHLTTGQIAQLRGANRHSRAVFSQAARRNSVELIQGVSRD